MAFFNKPIEPLAAGDVPAVVLDPSIPGSPARAAATQER
jgi:hypothetical protein